MALNYNQPHVEITTKKKKKTGESQTTKYLWSKLISQRAVNMEL